MAGYVIIDIEITDEALFAEFAEKIVGIVEAQGGRYLVRGGAAEGITGGWTPGRVVVQEFDSLDAARGFVESEAYKELEDIRLRSMNTRMIIVEGV